jgi:hypothetical protein
MTRESILQNVLVIRDENGNRIENKNFHLYYSVNKYSSKKNSIWHVDLNGKHLSKKDKYHFEIKCVSCPNKQNIATTQFLRKINKCTMRCYLCRNLCPHKIEKQKEFMVGNNYASNTFTKDLLLIEKVSQCIEENIKRSNEEFMKLDDDFKDNYFRYHLTKDDYNRILPRIKSFQNGKMNDVANYEYIPVYKVNNQMKFSSYLYNKKENSLFKAHQPILKCDVCYQDWRAKSIEKFKNDVRITCKTCSFTNKVFCLRNTKNCIQENILYQSKLELKFIRWCNINNIVVRNGPTIDYCFGKDVKKYRVDFEIDSILIEIKDNHIWYSNDLKSGKAVAKENAVMKLIQDGKYKNFFMITPKKWLYYLETIKKLLNKI